ncbi:hypothetical protein OXPF_05810 [Oxobacter pfennigii]|uniref:Uncharacterized protein n=1 Tax=Oxobacter pfennigii TaxID=36849 RepID=A0A0N8NTU3_9CLOT|nr:hypothetical protein OXPF_05810 [Oxobacter pfennigii]
MYAVDETKWGFDAIDIDDTGYLMDANAPTNLTATATDNHINLSWDEVTGAMIQCKKSYDTWRTVYNR